MMELKLGALSLIFSNPHNPLCTAQVVLNASATHPAVIHPAVTHPTVTYPAVTHPAVTHPAVTHPAVTHPAATHPAATHPAATHSFCFIFVQFLLHIIKCVSTYY